MRHKRTRTFGTLILGKIARLPPPSATKSPRRERLTMGRQRYIWIEEYEGCDCSEEAGRKKDLFGYCSVHGGDRTNIYKVPVDKQGNSGIQKEADDG